MREVLWLIGLFLLACGLWVVDAGAAGEATLPKYIMRVTQYGDQCGGAAHGFRLYLQNIRPVECINTYEIATDEELLAWLQKHNITSVGQVRVYRIDPTPVTLQVEKKVTVIQRPTETVEYRWSFEEPNP